MATISFIVLSLLTGINAQTSSFENTMFYSTAVTDIDLKRVTVEEAKDVPYAMFEKTGRKNARLRLSKAYFDYYREAPELNKKILIKLASLGILEKIPEKKKLGDPYSLLYKKNRSFNLETLAYVPVPYEKGIPVIRDFDKYNDWVLRDINVRRDGAKGKYFVDINSMRFVLNGRFFDTRLSMNTIFKGRYRLDLLIDDQTEDKKSPNFTLKMRSPSKLAKDVRGTFYFVFLPGEPYFLIYFTGKTEVNWTLYNFLPLALVRSEVLERIYTLLENIQYRALSVKKPTGSVAQLK